MIKDRIVWANWNFTSAPVGLTGQVETCVPGAVQDFAPAATSALPHGVMYPTGDANGTYALAPWYRVYAYYSGQNL